MIGQVELDSEKWHFLGGLYKGEDGGFEFSGMALV